MVPVLATDEGGSVEEGVEAVEESSLLLKGEVTEVLASAGIGASGLAHVCSEGIDIGKSLGSCEDIISAAIVSSKLERVAVNEVDAVGGDSIYKSILGSLKPELVDRHDGACRRLNNRTPWLRVVRVSGGSIQAKTRLNVANLTPVPVPVLSRRIITRADHNFASLLRGINALKAGIAVDEL
ncbi:hypothetical protein BC829DRAFT_260239 [Chytridium lagenaria]|nr:hypothetical protein BC829DRAFT_260239 [Chytridium lagenaria]